MDQAELIARTRAMVEAHLSSYGVQLQPHLVTAKLLVAQPGEGDERPPHGDVTTRDEPRTGTSVLVRLTEATSTALPILTAEERRLAWTGDEAAIDEKEFCSMPVHPGATTTIRDTTSHYEAKNSSDTEARVVLLLCFSSVEGTRDDVERVTAAQHS